LLIVADSLLFKSNNLLFRYIKVHEYFEPVDR